MANISWSVGHHTWIIIKPTYEHRKCWDVNISKTDRSMSDWHIVCAIWAPAITDGSDGIESIFVFSHNVLHIVSSL